MMGGWIINLGQYKGILIYDNNDKDWRFMKPIYQTEKTRFASCIASILEVELKDVDVDITDCNQWIQVFNKMRETKKSS